MSTRNKGRGKGRGLDPHSFVKRAHHMDPLINSIILSLHLTRVALEAAEANVDHWVDLAALVNVGGTFAKERKNNAWLADLTTGADALREVLARNERVGGRWVATPSEAADIHVAINCLDKHILPAMTMPEFIRIGQAILKLSDEGAK